jgi:hypothetical protein
MLHPDSLSTFTLLDDAQELGTESDSARYAHARDMISGVGAFRGGGHSSIWPCILAAPSSPCVSSATTSDSRERSVCTASAILGT